MRNTTYSNGESAMGDATHGSREMPWGMVPVAGEKVWRGRLPAAGGRELWGMLSVTGKKMLVHPDHLQ